MGVAENILGEFSTDPICSNVSNVQTRNAKFPFVTVIILTLSII